MEHYSLFRKDKCTGEREGGKPPLAIGIIAIKND